MKQIHRIFAGLVLVGGATLASAQSPQAQGFAERFAELQALSSNSSRFQQQSMAPHTLATRDDETKTSLAKWWADVLNRAKKS